MGRLPRSDLQRRSGGCAVAICDIDRARAGAFAREHRIPEVYTDHRDMPTGCDCDAVAVVTPNFLHGAIAVDCANAGKHLLIEKPLTTTRDQDVLVTNSVFGRCQGFAYESIRSFVDQLLADKPFHVSLYEAANVSLAILGIMASAERGEPVPVERI